MIIKLDEHVKNINALLEQQGMNPLPDLYKHMVLAIFRKGPKTSSNFIRSMDAAFTFLLKHGHITPQSNINNIQLTSTGKVLNAPHTKEPPDKSELFDTAFEVTKQTR